MTDITMECRVIQGLFGRWFLFHKTDDQLAWSGSHWVRVTMEGYPTGGVQVCNFDTHEAATEYAAKMGIVIQ